MPFLPIRFPGSSTNLPGIACSGWGFLASTPFIGVPRNNFSHFFRGRLLSAMLRSDSTCPDLVHSLSQSTASSVRSCSTRLSRNDSPRRPVPMVQYACHLLRMSWESRGGSRTKKVGGGRSLLRRNAPLQAFRFGLNVFPYCWSPVPEGAGPPGWSDGGPGWSPGWPEGCWGPGWPDG